MFEQTVSAEHIWLVEELARIKSLNNFYLVGGTSLALQLGHRESIDLDFFSFDRFDKDALLLDVKTRLKKHDVQTEGTYGVIVNGVKVDFVYWPFPTKYNLIDWRGIKLLDKKDIAMYKLIALAGRNVKKDLADLYFIDKEVSPLENVFQDFKEINTKGDYDVLGTIKLLFDEESIKSSPEPKMLKEYDFEKALEFIKNKLRDIVRKDLQLSKHLK